MPPKIVVNKEEVLDAAVRVIRSEGFENLNARSLARILCCSTKPLFRIYRNMEELKFDVLVHLSGLLWRYGSVETGYPEFVMKYVRFAKDESNIFKALFMSGAISQTMISEMLAAKDVQRFITVICENEKIDRQQAQKVYVNMWFLAHGLACMIAANGSAVELAQADGIVLDSYHSFIAAVRTDG